MAGFSEKVYLRSPIWLQQVAVAAWGAAWYYRRFGPGLNRWIEEYQQRDRWTLDQFRQYQSVQLGRVLEAAWKSPYYREVFEKAGMTQGMDPWEALAMAPFLTKETLRSRANELLTQRSLPRGAKRFQTSGSTGTPTDLYYPLDFHRMVSAAVQVRNFRLAGVTYRDRRFSCFGRKVCRFDQAKPPFWRFSPLENMAYASSYHLSSRFLPFYLEFLRKYKPRVVTGYPSSLAAIARYAIRHNDLPPAARCALTTAEPVFPRDREAIETAWQCRLYDRYGASEECLFVGQCEHGCYHVSPDVGILDILDEQGKPCPPGIRGEVVCTGLHNTLQPLIRYRLGDAACWAADQHCRCGRNTPIIDSIEGRLEDLCITPDGRQVMRFHAVWYEIATVREAQVVQEKADLFVINLVATDEFSQRDAELIKSNMRSHVGDVEVRIQRVPAIEKAPSGKFRAVLCKLSRDECQRLLEQAGDKGR